MVVYRTLSILSPPLSVTCRVMSRPGRTRPVTVQWSRLFQAHADVGCIQLSRKVEPPRTRRVQGYVNETARVGR
jgi:hypothetical protein